MSEPHLSPQAYERLARRSSKSAPPPAAARSRCGSNAPVSTATSARTPTTTRPKNEQGHNEARVRQLEAMLKNAVVMDELVRPARSSSPECWSSSATTATTTPITYLVGSIEERHDTYDVLSTESPLGQALLGAGPGAKVRYQGLDRGAGRDGRGRAAVEPDAAPAAGNRATAPCGSRGRAARAAGGAATRARRARCGSARRRARHDRRTPRRGTTAPKRSSNARVERLLDRRQRHPRGRGGAAARRRRSRAGRRGPGPAPGGPGAEHRG